MNDSLDLNLDLLVDGELSEDRRTELLTQLDQSADGWKHCALRFLETQSWQSALKKTSTPSKKQRRSFWPVPLAAVASAAFGFFLAQKSISDPVVPESNPPEVAEISHAPVLDGLRLIPSRDESGSLVYICRDPLPAHILQAFQMAGHRVQEVEKTIPLSVDSTSLASLPLRETHIHINPQL